MAGDDGDGETGNADQSVVIITDADIPDLSAAAEMEGAGDTINETGRNRAQMIGVDLKADGRLAVVAQGEEGGKAPDRFGECDGSAAVQQTKGLGGAVVDRHARGQGVAVDGDEFNAEVAKEITGIEAVEFFQRIVAGPEFHVVILPQRTGPKR